MVCHSINDVCLALENGQIVGGGQGDPFNYMQTYWAPKMAEHGYTVTSWQIRTQEYAEGDIVEDWNSYILI